MQTSDEDNFTTSEVDQKALHLIGQTSPASTRGSCTLSLQSSDSVLSFSPPSDWQKCSSFALPKDHWLRAYHRFAHIESDLEVLATWLEIAEVPRKLVDKYLARLLLKVLAFLHLCDYPMEDIVTILAHAGKYFADSQKLCGSAMDSTETANVLAVFVFLAHCIVEDETCPLSVWHRNIFSKYCTLATLNAAVLRLMEQRHYTLRVADDVLSSNLQCFRDLAELHGHGDQGE